MVGPNGLFYERENDEMLLHAPRQEDIPPSSESPVMAFVVRDATGNATESVIIDEEIAGKIVQAVDGMDIRVALWGRRCGEALPVW